MNELDAALRGCGLITFVLGIVLTAFDVMTLFRHLGHYESVRTIGMGPLLICVGLICIKLAR